MYARRQGYSYSCIRLQQQFVLSKPIEVLMEVLRPPPAAAFAHSTSRSNWGEGRKALVMSMSPLSPITSLLLLFLSIIVISPVAGDVHEPQLKRRRLNNFDPNESETPCTQNSDCHLSATHPSEVCVQVTSTLRFCQRLHDGHKAKRDAEVGSDPCAIGTFAARYANSSGFTTQGSTFILNPDFSGVLACEKCPAGYYEPSVGSSDCHACAVGHAQPLAGQSTCPSCLSGQFAHGSPDNSDLASTSCKNCPAGYHQPNGAIGNMCQACHAGKAQNETKQQFCFDCKAGTYSNHTGQSLCKDCPAGHHSKESDVGGEVHTFCPACAKGHAQPWTTQKNCTECGGGKYADATGTENCKMCPPGYLSSHGGDVHSTCPKCARGHYNSEYGFGGINGTDNCHECEIGAYADEFATPICKDCPAGYSGHTTGLNTCDACTQTKYQSLPRATMCKFCEIGTYGDVRGLAAGKPCSMISYAAKKGLDSCDDCYTMTAYFGFSQPTQCWTIWLIVGAIVIVCCLLPFFVKFCLPVLKCCCGFCRPRSERYRDDADGPRRPRSERKKQRRRHRRKDPDCYNDDYDDYDDYDDHYYDNDRRTRHGRKQRSKKRRMRHVVVMAA